jgi:hypothetical protein
MIKPLEQSFLLLKLRTGPYFKCAQLHPFLQQSLIQCCTDMSTFTYQSGTSLDGQSEPAATSATVGRSVNWMAAFFHSTSDEAHHSPFLFAADHCTLFFGALFVAVIFLDLTSHIITLLTFLPS